ncbi:hypothetical protein PRECH8_15130 [Insulibacter thermoxylanivorax]|uniref:Uncharacterized protein n=1 Tax=Insulibacter thermoxylanivorax TaxID=2749268 RepID=A0A916QH05_9BACL|nr:hypothetical protein PRECH8_15130 [Insulibacter thermoxylanivorax]
MEELVRKGDRALLCHWDHSGQPIILGSLYGNRMDIDQMNETIGNNGD